MTVLPPKIPIRNLYYLLCYAWNHLEQGALVDISRDSSISVADLFAKLLCDGVEHISRRGMQQGYEQREEELAGLRGRIDLIGSARRLLLEHGRANCTFDELSVDTHANRLIKATLKVLSGAAEDDAIRKRVRALHTRLREIGEVRLSKQMFRSVQISSNERFYRFLIHICEFVFSSCLVDSRTGTSKFRDFLRDERAMARVFEDFLLNFLKHELKTWNASRENIRWDAASDTDGSLSLLPRMRTDVILRSGERCRIADAKYYSASTSNYYETEKIHAANLYQLMSYVSNASAAEPYAEIAGILIYPRVDRTLRERYRIQGHVIEVCTVDLSADWREIHSELLSLFQ
jgi:5-methylcytosine-specific restriction enzyme subunit McrC